MRDDFFIERQSNSLFSVIQFFEVTRGFDMHAKLVAWHVIQFQTHVRMMHRVQHNLVNTPQDSIYPNRLVVPAANHPYLHYISGSVPKLCVKSRQHCNYKMNRIN